MGNFIDDLLMALSEEDRKRVDDHLMGLYQDPTALTRRGFDPDNYSYDLLRLTAYDEIIRNDTSRFRKFSGLDKRD
jgi:hypothetical protein